MEMGGWVVEEGGQQSRQPQYLLQITIDLQNEHLLTEKRTALIWQS